MQPNNGYTSLPSQDAPQSIQSSSIVLHKDGSYTYSYGQGLFSNKYTVLSALLASVGGLSFGYDQGVVANILVMPTFFRMEAWETGMMTAALELGAFLGCIIAGLLSDRMGSRGKSIALACLVFMGGGAIQCSATRVWHLVVGRGIGGLGVGALSMLSPLYLAEISPPSLRGSLMALEQLAIVSGVVLGFWLGFFTRSIPSSWSWRIPLAIQLVPGAILGIGCLFLPASPRLLVLQGKDDEASSVLARLRGRSSDDILVKLELLEMRVEARLTQLPNDIETKADGSTSTELKVWADLFRKRYRRRTMIGVLMMVFQQWSGINALLYYGPTLVRSIGLSGDTVKLLVSGGIGIVQLVAVVPAIVYIDKAGRKPLLRTGGVLMGLAHFAIAVLITQFDADWQNHGTAAWTAVICIYIFTFAYGFSFGPIGWVLPSEVFPLSVRSRGVAISTASNWLNNFIIGFITPVTLECSPAGTFMLFATFCFLAYLWATYQVPETAGIGLEEIQAVFALGAGGDDELSREEAETRRQTEEDLGLWRLVRKASVDTALAGSSSRLDITGIN